MSAPTDNLISTIQDVVDTVPEFLQPFIVAAAGTIPFVEGEGAAIIGVVGGLNPIVAALSAAGGNLLCVVLVVLLGARVRAALVARRARRFGLRDAAGGDVAATTSAGSSSARSSAPLSGAARPTLAGSVVLAPEAPGTVDDAATGRPSKGRQRLRRWLVRFGVPGASLLAPLALPTPFTAATLVASGVEKKWVILWQAVAIAVWTTGVTLVATGVVAILGAG